MENRWRSERGTGLLPTVLGLGVLLGTVGLASNVAIGLWDRSSIESLAYDAAREVATSDPSADQSVVRSLALERACDQLGDRCAEVSMRFTHTTGDPMVQLHVSAPGVALLPRMIARHGPVVGGLERTIRIHREKP